MLQQAVLVGLVLELLQGPVHFVQRTYAFKRLYGCDARKFIQERNQFRVVEQVLSEKAACFLNAHEWGENDKSEQAFGAFSAP